VFNGIVTNTYSKLVKDDMAQFKSIMENNFPGTTKDYGGSEAYEAWSARYKSQDPAAT
jgi:hypothetical protein